MSARDQQVIDRLQSAIPLAQLAAANAQRTSADLAAIVDALATMALLLRPSPAAEGSRTVAHLEQAVIRSGHTWAEVSHLSGLSRERLANVVAGDPLTKEERAALRRVLADWQG